MPRQNYQAVYKKVPVRVSRQVPKKVFQVGHSGVAPSEPTNTFVPEFVGSGTEIIDAREKSPNTEKTVQFERSQAQDSGSDNSIVFGD